MSPDIGYPDYQRVVDWDSPELWNETTQGNNATVASPLLDVSRFAYLGGSVGCSAGQVIMSVVWFLDSGGTIVTGSRYIPLWYRQSVAASIRIPNLGPFVKVTFTAIGGANYTATAKLFATNRYNPLEVIPNYPILLEIPSQQIVPGTAYYFYPDMYMSGPVVFLMQSGGANVEAIIGCFDQNGNGVQIYDHSPTGATEYNTVVIPFSGWYVELYGNGGVDGTFGGVIVPSYTGST